MSSRTWSDPRLARLGRWSGALGGALLLAGLAWARYAAPPRWVWGLDGAAFGAALLAWSLLGLAAARFFTRARPCLAGIAGTACLGLAAALAHLEPRPYGIPLVAIALRQALAATSLVATVLASSLWTQGRGDGDPLQGRWYRLLAFLAFASGLFGLAAAARLGFRTTLGLPALLALGALTWWAGQRVS